jgi:N-acetylneuraminate epimerase
MNRISILILFIIMSFNTDTVAQQNTLININWKISGIIPPAPGETNAPGLAGPVAGIHNNVLMVAGGANFPGEMPWNGGQKKYHKEVYIFQNSNDSLVHLKTLELPFTIAYSATCSTPYGVLSVGGENQNGLTDMVFLLEWSVESGNILRRELPSLPYPLTNASVVFAGEKIYVAGGERLKDVSNELLVLDLKDLSVGWKLLPSLPIELSHAVMIADSSADEDLIFILGGRKRNPGSTSDFYSSVFAFDIRKGKWTTKKKMPYALSAGTGSAAGGGQLLAFGGDAGETFEKTERLIADINKETDPEKKQQLNQTKINLQSSHPGFCRQVLLYNVKKDDWQKLDCIPFEAPVTTTAVRWNDTIFIPSGEIRAGVRSPKILSAKLSQNLQ